MSIRLAGENDISSIAAIYDAAHTEEEAGRTTVGWIRSIYPTEQTARTAVSLGDMYVLEEDGRVCACARINREQVPEYANANWAVNAPDDEVLVLHTLVVDPACQRRGFARQMVAFYEQEAIRLHCPHLRMDTNARNTRARSMYAKLGYTEADIVDCVFNGIPGVRLVCLEKNL